MVFCVNTTFFANKVYAVDKNAGTTSLLIAINQSQSIKTASSQTNTQNVNINVKDIDVNDVLLKDYHEKYKKRDSKSDIWVSKQTINDTLKGYEDYDYPLFDNFNKSDKKILRFELQDGDYAILDTNVKGHKNFKYVAEYHKDGSLFGIVQIKTIHKSRKSATIAFYEYRDEYLDFYKIKHLMFVDIKKDNNKNTFAQFIYKDGLDLNNLICAQVNNDLYLNDESKNLIVKMQKFDVPKEYSKFAENTKKTVAQVGAPVINTVVFVKDITVHLITVPFKWVGFISDQSDYIPMFIIVPLALPIFFLMLFGID